MRNLEIVIKISDMSPTVKSKEECSEILGKVKAEVDLSKSNGFGVTENGTRYNWDTIRKADSV